MVVLLKVSLEIITLKEKEFLNGLMEKHIKEIGYLIKCQEWEK
jgi:hypothetical protein